MISVMIPAYNAENTIRRSVESVRSQSLQDFEIVIINDGSTDRTGEILDAYAALDARIRVFHQENRGISASRNRAIQVCRGALLTFVDADDVLLPGYLATLYKAMQETGAACVCCNHWIVQGAHRYSCFSDTQPVRVFTPEQALENILYHGVPDVSAWGKLYRRGLLEQIRYPEGALFEDAFVIADVVLAAGTIAFVPEPLYVYTLSDSSISRTCAAGHEMDLPAAVNRMTDRIRECYPQLERGCIRRRAHALLSAMRVLDPAVQKSVWADARRQLLGYALPVLFDTRAPARDKLGILAALPGHRFYRFVWGLYDKHRRRYG